MKIIFIANNNIGNGLSGGDRIFLEFLKNWQSKAQFTVLACQESSNLIKNYGIKKINILTTDNKANTSKNIFSVLSLLKHIIRRTFLGVKTVLLNKKLFKEADYVYSVSDFYPDFFPALVAKLLCPKIKWIAGFYLFAPLPFSKDSPYKDISFSKGLFYWLMQRPTYILTKIFSNIVFVTSQPDVDKFPNKKVVVIRGGVDVTESEKYLKTQKLVKNKKYQAVFIGRFHPQKGVLELIDIWKTVVQKLPKAKLAIIGNGELERQIKSKIKKYRLSKNIDLLGFLNGQNKYEIFKQSQIVVHPATYDSGGMAAAEAMAWGIPGVSFDLEALKTYYPKGMIKTDCFNKISFAENIVKLLIDESLYKKTAKEARKLILENWDWTKRSEDIFSKTFRS